MAKLREMGGEAEKDGWRSQERWVAKLRKMVGEAKRDGWRS